MKHTAKLITWFAIASLTALLPACQSTGGSTGTHEMGLGKPRMPDNAMPAKYSEGQNSTGAPRSSSVGGTHEMGLGKPRMPDKAMPDRYSGQ